MRKLLIIAFLGLCVNLWAYHPMHITIVNMELDEQNEKINYSIRLFQEDLIILMNYLVHEELHKGKTEEEAFADSNLIPNYFKKSLIVVSDNNILTPEFSKQINNESEVWLYFQIDLKNIPSNISIENKIYKGIFKDQMNMLIFAVGKKEKAFTFNSDITRQLIALNDI